MIYENVVMLRTRFDRPALLREWRIIEKFLLPRSQIGRHGFIARLGGRGARAIPHHAKRMPVKVGTVIGTSAILPSEPVI